MSNTKDKNNKVTQVSEDVLEPKTVPEENQTITISKEEYERLLNASAPKKNKGPAPKWTEEQLNEYVEVTLFSDGERYKDDVIVSVNDETIRIKRGVPVKIKRKFANVLEYSRIQQQKAAAFSASQSALFEEQSLKYGM